MVMEQHCVLQVFPVVCMAVEVENHDMIQWRERLKMTRFEVPYFTDEEIGLLLRKDLWKSTCILGKEVGSLKALTGEESKVNQSSYPLDGHLSGDRIPLAAGTAVV